MGLKDAALVFCSDQDLVSTASTQQATNRIDLGPGRLPSQGYGDMGPGEEMAVIIAIRAMAITTDTNFQALLFSGPTEASIISTDAVISSTGIMMIEDSGNYTDLQVGQFIELPMDHSNRFLKVTFFFKGVADDLGTMTVDAWLGLKGDAQTQEITNP